jgi:glycopeptide antibiotics resistance protein
VVPFADTAGVFDALVALGGSLVQAVPVGVLAVLCVSGASRGLTASLLALAAIAGLEFLQLLVLSRTADSTDVLGGAIGALIGVRLGALWLARLETPAPAAASARSSSVRLWAVAALLLWILVLLVRHWSPFDFTVDRAMFESRVSQLYTAPFYHHYWSDYLHALDEALETMLLAVPVGLLLQVVWPPPQKRSARAAQLLTFVAAAGALFAVIEVGQVFVPSRVPDNTDVVLAMFGTLAGIAIVRMVRRPSARAG